MQFFLVGYRGTCNMPLVICIFFVYKFAFNYFIPCLNLWEFNFGNTSNPFLRSLRGRLPKSGTGRRRFEFINFISFCAMKGIHVQVTKRVLVCENNLKWESTRRFKFWLSRYPGRPVQRVIWGQL